MSIEKKMTDKDELYRGKAGKKASCKKMRGMNEKQKARKKCEIEWGEETAGRVEQHFLFADRHHLHLEGINIIAVTWWARLVRLLYLMLKKEG